MQRFKKSTAYIVKADQKNVPAGSKKKVNLCLDEKQDRVLKPLQRSCIGGNSAIGGHWQVEGMREGEESLAYLLSAKVHWAP